METDHQIPLQDIYNTAVFWKLFLHCIGGIALVNGSVLHSYASRPETRRYCYYSKTRKATYSIKRKH